jgi:hypothetical protein
MFMSDPEVEEEPYAAYWLSLIGGIIGIIISFIVLGISAWTASLASDMFVTYTGPGPALIGAIGIWCLITGGIVVVAAGNLKSNPWEHSKWGVVIVVFSVIGAASIIGLIGGIFALVYKPKESVPHRPPSEATKKFCPNCGRAVNEETKFCPNCGRQV